MRGYQSNKPSRPTFLKIPPPLVVIIMNIFFILILSFFSLNCFFSSEISFDDSEQWRQELSENLFEAIKSYEAIVVPSPVSVDQPVGSEFALEQQIIEYPEIPCAFNSVQQALFAVIRFNTFRLQF